MGKACKCGSMRCLWKGWVCPDSLQTWFSARAAAFTTYSQVIGRPVLCSTRNTPLLLPPLVDRMHRH